MISSDYTISVTKFNSIIRDIFGAEELLHNIKICGEVFGISKAKSAVYFSIKDEESTLPCVCFYVDLLSNIKEGDSVVVTGSPNFYTKAGRFSFIVNRIEPYGLGILYQRFLEMKSKLEAEGLFDESHKKEIPSIIKRIGVVTSKDGAVIQDIKNVCWRRNRAVDIVLYDSKVQGNGAEREIAKGIEFFSQYKNVDVVVVARGGGSLEDLAAYNTEIVARAAYDCKKPIVSAVGHEVDFTIIDFVADMRAPTPSAAAELLTKDTKLSLASFKREISVLSRLIENYVAQNTMSQQNLTSNFLTLAKSYVSEQKKKISRLTSQLSSKLNQIVLEEDYASKLRLATIKKLNPLDILRLGYAKIETTAGTPISDSKEVEIGSAINIHFADGLVEATAKAKKERK